MIFKLPDFPYAYNALEPYFDGRTMEIHHCKHHGAYVDKLNKALEGHDLHYKCIGDLLSDIGALPKEIRTAVRNHGGGHANHSMFWKILSPDGGGKPHGELADAIDRDLGGFDQFQKTFTKVALNHFGSGWAWLGLDADHKLILGSTRNQDSPMMHKHVPMMGLDLWEHAYYLKYQNRRADYVEAFWNVLSWDAVMDRYSSVMKGLHVAHAS